MMIPFVDANYSCFKAAYYIWSYVASIEFGKRLLTERLLHATCPPIDHDRITVVPLFTGIGTRSCIDDVSEARSSLLIVGPS